MNPQSKEVIECVIRAAEKAKDAIHVRVGDQIATLNYKVIDADLFIQALKNELV